MHHVKASTHTFFNFIITAAAAFFSITISTISMTIAMGGGSVLIFAYGGMPTPLDLKHIHLEVKTTAFKAVISTRTQESSRAQAQPGLWTSFLEKSQTDWWGKYVLAISEAQNTYL